jgi:hypothetical protein
MTTMRMCGTAAASLLLASASLVSAQPAFSATFAEKTMRVDYYHSGGGQEIFALDRIVSDGTTSRVSPTSTTPPTSPTRRA